MKVLKKELKIKRKIFIVMSKNKKKNWAENGLEDWGSYMAAKKEKLEDQFSEEAKKEFQDATSIFSGIAIFVNGYTDPCADELKRLMMAHGGIYHHYMRSRITTHIIASNLPYTKIVMYRKSQNPLPICKPEWITDSLKAKKLLDWRPYVLYSNCTKTQPQLNFIERAAARPNETSETPDSVTRNERELKIEVKASSCNNAPISTKNSEFLTEFYNNSRLHHISTMGATFKDYVNELRAKNDETYPGLERLKRESAISDAKIPNESDSDDDLFESPIFPKQSKRTNLAVDSVIMHIDMDCFFVSVGLRNRPEFRGLPVAVTHAKVNRKVSTDGTREDANNEEEYGSMSEIACCSYEARKCGVKNGMFLGQALKLCPDLRTMKYDFEDYKKVSYALYDTVASYTLLIEAVSCDEMYADVTKVLEISGLSPMEFATIIRNEIRERTLCPVSAGFGSNKLQARLATRKAKPDGQCYLDKRRFDEHIGCMVVRDLPGVGYSTMKQLLSKMNVRTCDDLRDVSLIVLQKEFGKKTGEMLHNMCRGIDNSKLNFEHVRKSISAEVNYGIRFETPCEAENFLGKLSEEVCERLQKAKGKGRSVTLKLMVRAKDAPKEALKYMGHGICDNFTRSKNLIAPVDDPIIITREVMSLWKQMQQPFEDIRGIGIQISRLESSCDKRTGTMLNFINKSRQLDDERSIDREKVSSSMNSDHELAKKSGKIATTNPRDPKSGSLKTFLVPKSQIVTERRNFGNAIASKEHEMEEIDETVLAELPEEIRKEIFDARGKKIDESSTIRRTELEKIKNSDQSDLSTVSEEINLNSSPVELSSAISYDESILRELPEEIRHEILGTKKFSSKPEVNKAAKSGQTVQEKYFKHVKPSSDKFAKSKMPPIEEIDMSVLIELPEDIRNEIMNAYKAKKRENLDVAGNEKIDASSGTGNRENNDEKTKNREIQEDTNVSFSQVDPDFLAALSEEMKTDVEMYCMAKKKEKLMKIKKLSEANTGHTRGIVKNRNSTKLSGKNIRTKKSSNKIVVSVAKVTNDRKNVEEISDGERNTEFSTEANSTRFLDRELPIDEKTNGTLEQREEIISHHSSFTGKKARTEEQEMLTSLVNYLFTIPRKQVKMQIQTWISNGDNVNEIDLLSLATFLSMLPKKKRLEDLHVLLKTMHRCITKTGSCVWHETYRRTVCHVQRYMRIEYKGKLMLPEIECDHCETSS